MLQVLGRLHPLLVHFPIALLLAALVAECLRPRKQGPSEAGFFCLALGAAGALAAALSGWLFAAHDPPGMPALLLKHRWSGIGAAVTAGVTLVSAWRWRRTGTQALARPTRAGLVLTALLAGLSAHLGGSMVYGEGFLLQALEPSAPAPDAPALESTPAPAASIPAAGLEPSHVVAELAPASGSAGDDRPPPVVFLAEIRPLFERHCFECHGEKKRPKGKLKLTDMAAVLARAPSEAALVPGDPGASLLYQRISLPPEHEDRMPPEGEPLSAEELELVRRWIAEGAPWSAPPSAVPAASTPDVVRALVLTEAQRAARDAALERLRARGARAQRVSAAGEEVEVDLGVATPACTDAELALLAGLEPCLVELSLARTEVSDAGLTRLADFRALRRLRLEHTALGDAALVPLARLPALESLNLFGTRVGAGGLTALSDMPRLARLYAGETDLGDAALDELARSRPGLLIERGHLPSAAAGGSR